MHFLLFGMHLSSAGHGSVTRPHTVLLRTGALLEEECYGTHDKETNNNNHSHRETGIIVPIVLAYTLLGSRINDATTTVEIERVVVDRIGIVKGVAIVVVDLLFLLIQRVGIKIIL